MQAQKARKGFQLIRFKPIGKDSRQLQKCGKFLQSFQLIRFKPIGKDDTWIAEMTVPVLEFPTNPI